MPSTHEPTDAGGPDLRTVLARLRELERKCRTMSARSEDLAEMQPRLERIVELLESGREHGAVSYRSLARQLAPVERAFDQLRFATVAREVRYVADALESLEPPPERARPADGASPGEPGEVVDGPAQARPDGEEQPRAPLGWRERLRPTPAITILVVALGVTCVAAWLVVRSATQRGTGDPAPAAAATPERVPAATRAPQPTATPPPPAVSNRSVLPAAISDARLALRSGDVDAAIERLSDAARIDPRHGLVLEMAALISDALVADADSLAERSRWTDAEARLERARRLALRFDLDRSGIEAAAQRHASMPRIEIVHPTDRAGLARLVGREVELIMRTGAPIDGEITAVDDRRVVMRRAKHVEGGTVYYQDQIPLSSVVEVRAAPPG